MKFKIINTSKPRKIALFLSITVTLFVTVLYIILSYFFYNNKSWWIPLIITDTSIFIFTYFIFEISIKNFIYDKIRLIYKIIRNLKLQKDEKPDIDLNKDIIKEVREEVEDWGLKHNLEITTLKEREEFRREFIGNISHELKNPVFNIQGYVYSLIDGAKNDLTLSKKYLKRTAKNIERIITIIEDLDTISELEVKGIKTNFKTFDLLNLTEEVVELFDEKTIKKNIKIFFREKYFNPTYAFGDEHRIKQVLVNLVDNAVKYSFKGGKIKISFFDMDKNHLIEITDEGPGISEEDLPRIFERFYRTDKARSRDKGGTGLGLSIVKHIIEAHNQTINVRSTLGVGTTFAFTIKKA